MISGTADTHEYHLERLVKKCLIERGYSEIIDEGDILGQYPEQPLAYFIVQIDKSTCQSYNLKQNFFGYRGVPISQTQLLLEDIAKKTRCSLWSLYRRRIRMMLTAVILCFTLLKSGNCEVISTHCVLSTYFVIWSGRVVKFAIHERYNDALCGRFG